MNCTLRTGIRVCRLTCLCRSSVRFCRPAALGHLPGVAAPERHQVYLFSALRARDSAVRRSWDACAARSKAGPVMGLCPLLGPPCIPPEAPPKKGFQLPQNSEGNAAIAAGASLTRCARSGDLPPRRVNARGRLRFDQYPLQPNSTDLVARLGNGFVLFPHGFWVFSHLQARANHNKKLCDIAKLCA